MVSINVKESGGKDHRGWRSKFCPKHIGKQKGTFQKNIYFSWNDDNSKNRIAIVLLGNINKSLLAYNTVNDRIISMGMGYQ